MGVYIKNMEKPKSCEECSITLWGLPKGCNFVIEMCPMTEIKEPHGRLVDIDKTMKIVASGIQLDVGELSELTTVIEAEVE